VNHTLHVGMGRRDGRLRLNGLRNLVAVGINKAGARLVARLKLDLALEGLDLLLVEEVAVLIAIFDALLASNNRMAGRGRGTGYGGLLVNNGNLGRRNCRLGNYRSLRLFGRGDCRDGRQRAVRIIL
jgi:hypothetical protein